MFPESIEDPTVPELFDNSCSSPSAPHTDSATLSSSLPPSYRCTFLCYLYCCSLSYPLLRLIPYY